MSLAALKKTWRSSPQLPPELWFLITSYLEKGDVDKLIGLHSIFYSIVMDRRYWRVELLNGTPEFNFEKIVMLRNPQIANRVRAFKLWPSATWDMIYAPPKPVITTPPPTLHEKFRQLFTRKKPSLPTPSLWNRISSSEKEQTVAHVAGTLLGLRELSITWHVYWEDIRPSQHPVCPILAVLLPAVGPNLRSLTLDISLSILHMSVLDTSLPSSHFSRLQKLSITFRQDDSRYFRNIELDAMAPFMNGFSATLTSLTIKTVDHIRLSKLLDALEISPSLTEFSLYIPFDVYHTPDAAAWHRLFLNMPSLQDLTIRNRFCCMDGATQLLGVLATWYKGIFTGLPFKHLRSVHLRLGYGLFVIMECLQPSKPRTLTSLTLLDMRLSPSDVTDVLAALGGSSLKVLELRIGLFTIPLIGILAETCPNLHRLYLDVENIGRGGEDSYQMASQFHAALTNVRAFDHHVAAMYDLWKLADLEIWMPEHGVRTMQWDIMRSMTYNIPSITSFARQSYKRL